MTAKEELHLLVDEIDDDRAEEVLVQVKRLLAHDARESPFGPEVDLMVVGKPPDTDNPLWRWVGSVKTPEGDPTDVALNHDKYLADAYEDLHDDE